MSVRQCTVGYRLSDSNSAKLSGRYPYSSPRLRDQLLVPLLANRISDSSFQNWFTSRNTWTPRSPSSARQFTSACRGIAGTTGANQPELRHEVQAREKHEPLRLLAQFCVQVRTVVLSVSVQAGVVTGRDRQVADEILHAALLRHPVPVGPAARGQAVVRAQAHQGGRDPDGPGSPCGTSSPGRSSRSAISSAIGRYSGLEIGGSGPPFQSSPKVMKWSIAPSKPGRAGTDDAAVAGLEELVEQRVGILEGEALRPTGSCGPRSRGR